MEHRESANISSPQLVIGPNKKLKQSVCINNYLSILTKRYFEKFLGTKIQGLICPILFYFFYNSAQQIPSTLKTTIYRLKSEQLLMKILKCLHYSLN